MRIVCSIDESTAARHAAGMARHLAGRMPAELVYVHSETGESSERIGVRTRRRCDLLIAGFTARAPWSSALVGEAHRRLVRDAACPVMLVPNGAGPRLGTSVVLGYDLPSVSGAAAAAAGRLAAALDSSLVVSHVHVPGATRRATNGQVSDAARRVVEDALAAAGEKLEVTLEERRGRPSAQLDKIAATHDAAVIVVGNPGSWRSALSRSVTTQLQRHARHPVLVVPRRAALLAG